MRSFHLTVARVGENLFDGEAVSVTLPGKEGVFQVLAGHEPLVAELSPGELSIAIPEGETKRFAVPHRAVAEVSAGEVTILF